MNKSKFHLFFNLNTREREDQRQVLMELVSVVPNSSFGQLTSEECLRGFTIIGPSDELLNMNYYELFYDAIHFRN